MELRPVYISSILAGWERRPEIRPAPEDRFLHLGHWDDPESPASSSLVEAQRRLDERMIELAMIRDEDAIVDVGCGFGTTLMHIAARGHRGRLFGINIDDRQIEIARAAFPSATWIVADAVKTPLSSGLADRVLAIECVFHFSSRALFFQEAARLLRPGGLLILSDFVADDRLRETRRGSPEAAAIIRHLGPWPDLYGREGSLDDLARRAGFATSARIDATAQTLPSYRRFVPDPASRKPLKGTESIDKGLSALESLSRKGFLRMEYRSFKKAAGRPAAASRSDRAANPR